MHLDINTYLQPISQQQPCGTDFSFSNIFHEIKKAKTQDDLLLDQGDWVTEPKQADWSFVAQKSMELFTESTKDIRLLNWLTEAWSHLYGFAGIAFGLELSHQILQKYWCEIHPVIDDGDLEQRLSLLQGLINQLPTLIKQIPLGNGLHRYNLFDYEKLLYQQNHRLKHSHDGDEPTFHLEMEQFEKELNHTTQSTRVANYQHFQNILEHWEINKKILDQLLGPHAPSFSPVDTHLASVHTNLKKIYKISQLIQPEIAETTPAVRSEQGMDQNNNRHAQQTTPTQSRQSPFFEPLAQNHVQNRLQAMRILQEISDYFAENEPQSPVSYMLRKTIKWSQLPLHEWLAQVVKNENPLESLQEQLGVKTPSNESNDW